MRFIFLSIFICALSGTSFSQEDSTKTIELENVVIQGNRIQIPFKETSRNISIITAHDIANVPVQSIPELLTYVPGVDIRQRGPIGVQSDISIRGGTFEQTLVLLNGIKLSDPQTGHHMMNIPLSFSNLTRVEVLKGPGARIYGQNAFSGAVNFITTVPDERFAKVRLYGGSPKLFGGSVGISLPTKKYNQYISYSRDVSDGYNHDGEFRYNTDFKINNFFYQSELDLSGGKLEIIGGLTDRKFGANGFYANPNYSEQYEEVQTSLLSVGYVKKYGNITIQPRVYWRRNRDNYFFVRGIPEVYENLHITNVGAAEVNSYWVNPLGKTGIGLEFRKETIHGDWVRGGNESKSNLDGFYRNNFGTFLEHQFRINKLDITPGVYIAHYSDFGWNAFPGIDIGYALSNDLRLYSNLGKSYRVPTFYDMYYTSPVEEGNPNLKPEEAVTFELGARYIKNAFNFEFNWFYQDAHDLIDWVGVPVTDSTILWKATNIAHIKRNGIEIAAHLNMEKLINSRIGLKNVYMSYNYINSDLDSNAEISRYILENLRQQFIFGLNARIVSNLFLDFKTRMNQREGDVSYWLFDARIYWTTGQGPYVYVEATNITNTLYTEVMTPMPDRWFRAGLVFQLGF